MDDLARKPTATGARTRGRDPSCARPRPRDLTCLWLGLLAVALASAPTASAYPAPGYVTDDTIINDPSMLIRPSTPRYVVYGTHNATLISNDRVGFGSGGSAFPLTPFWWQPYSDGDMWAPDVSYHAGRYWMYYAVSKQGSQYSAIGLATSPTGLAGSWTDKGPIIASNYGDSYNAIDPNLLVDATGRWWLTFGSFWRGIFMIGLDPATGMPSSTPPQMYHLAERPAVPGDPVEGGFVHRHGGYYYLFSSFDYCCKGSQSSYSIRVGRASSPTGPYADESGGSLLNGGGTKVLAGHDNVVGPGGQSAYHDDADNLDLLVYHYYDTALGSTELGINALKWDRKGFPAAY